VLEDWVGARLDPVFEHVFDGAAIGMALKLDGRLTRVNRALCELTGRSAEDLLAIDPVELLHPDERDAHAATERELVSGDAASSTAETRLLGAGGDDVHVRESATVLDDGRLLLQFEPAGAEAHTAVEDHDPVTGLFNRRRFEEELSRHVAEAARHGDRGAALMLDLDENFSELDDAQGEQLLKTVADALKQNITEAEMLAHLGGDEFAVLLPHADAARARKIAETIVEAVGPQVVKVGDQSVRVTIDVGVALFDERDDDPAAGADGASAAEPPAGDNLPAPIDQSHQGPGTALAPADGLVDRIRQALAEDSFALYAQPIIDLRTSEITQYELLLRMKDESGRLLLPDKFLPAAERAGLMPAIDQWVVRQAIGLIHEAAQDGRRLLLEVNVSADSVDDPALTALIEAELDATGVDPRLLVIEITEDAALAKVAETIKLSKWIRSMGCRFALDDFGSTFATVKYLKDMPVDYFKLDGDLIVTLPESRTNQLLLNALMDVARGTGTQTIAVYVPDDETLVMLRQYGIGYGQGNRVGRPRPVGEI
jgi:diguanylate cyclase (GGDEF)-like protein/PAS domain S-box-containing protein